MLHALSLATLSVFQGAAAPQSPAADDGALRDPELIAGGAYSFEPSTDADDAVPLPTPALYELDADGDRELAPASGDPYFLGFAAGAYYPSEDELIDPALTAQMQSAWLDGRTVQESYAFVMFSKRITDARLAQLAELGVRVLGFHPHYTMKVALAPGVAEQIAALDFVRWVGVPKAWQRVHPALLDVLANTPDGKPVDAWVNVYDSDLNPESSSTPIGSVSFGGAGEVEVAGDAQRPQVWMSNGWQQRALEELGLEVREYVDDLRAFRVRLAPASLELLTGLDFVQFVEPEVAPTLAHDESMPMILADRTRATWDGGTSDAVVGGQVDSGIEYSHQGVTGFAWVSVNFTGESSIDDLCGHGTHVAGTFHGNGNVEDSYEGVANGLGWGATGRFFNGKHFSATTCSSSGASLASIMSGMHTAYTDGNGATSPRPHVVNHSWGSVGSGWVGTEADCREIDAETYTYGQLHVWAAGNEGSSGSTLRLQPTAKNAFTVGGVRDYASGGQDPGALYTSSSRGPTGDLRWKPNVCAPATNILSADADTTSGYTNKTGTSMAAPHVAGLAAQLCDHYSFLRYNPSALGAVLMATAMTSNDQVLDTPSTSSSHHMNTFGTGRIEALKSHLMTAGTGLYFWGWTQGTSGTNYVDLDIGTGVDRLVVCLFYVEPACSSGASVALVNDLDLYLDRAPFTAGATGEYTGQQSTRDNTEIRILTNPTSGLYRFKVDSDSATTNSYVGLCAFIAYGDTTPDGSLNVTADDYFVKPNEDVWVTAAAYNPSYIASAVYFDSTSSGDTLQASITQHEDGAFTDLMNNQTSGRDVLVGDIAAGDTRAATWVTRWASQGVKSFSVNARSDNWVDATDAVSITVDGTAPVGPTSLVSPSHVVNQVSCSTTVSMQWVAASDALSGLLGYIGVWNTTAVFDPTGATNIAAGATTFGQNIGSSASARYFHLRAVDKSGNYGTTQHFGPVFADAIPVATYCTGKTNSAGCVPSAGTNGVAPSKAAGNFTVTCSNVINNKVGHLFWGYTQAAIPFQGGIKCIAAPTLRTDNQASGGSASGIDCTGTFVFTFTTAFMNANGINAGDTLHAQWWMRDPGSASTTGLSDAVKFTVCN